MARIAGVDLPKKARIEFALTKIYGIGRVSSQRIIKETGVNPDVRVSDLKDNDVVKIRSLIEKEYKVEGDLRRDNSMNIKRLIDISCYRGTRHKLGLPVRGQRTRTNARTRKGPRKAAVSAKKKEA